MAIVLGGDRHRRSSCIYLYIYIPSSSGSGSGTIALHGKEVVLV